MVNRKREEDECVLCLPLDASLNSSAPLRRRHSQSAEWDEATKKKRERKEELEKKSYKKKKETH